MATSPMSSCELEQRTGVEHAKKIHIKSIKQDQR